jgi:hypothetical protein
LVIAEPSDGQACRSRAVITQAGYETDPNLALEHYRDICALAAGSDVFGKFSKTALLIA